MLLSHKIGAKGEMRPDQAPGEGMRGGVPLSSLFFAAFARKGFRNKAAEEADRWEREAGGSCHEFENLADLTDCSQIFF